MRGGRFPHIRSFLCVYIDESQQKPRSGINGLSVKGNALLLKEAVQYIVPHILYSLIQRKDR